jgi:alpha-L-rhamnosidase
LRRRTFIAQGTIITAGLHFRKFFSSSNNKVSPVNPLYSAFKEPENSFRPFVRWWWNGDKIEKDEITRELRLLRDAGIGGVEINSIKFPAKTDDLGKRSVPWLSDEWIQLVQFTIEEAKSLGVTCDLLAGSGWPFGGESLAEKSVHK